MKRFATSMLLSFGISPVFASAQDFTFSSQYSLQQYTIIHSGQPVPTANASAFQVEQTGVKGDWSKEEDRVDGAINKTKLEKMKLVTGALVDLLKNSYLGAGVYNPTWHGEYYSGKNSPGTQLKFGMTSHFAEQKADLSITANDMQPLLDQLVVNGQHFLTIRIATAIEKNTLYYADAESSESAGGQTKMWLVAAGNGQLPFTAVTRATYLTEAKAELTGMVKSIEAGWKLKVPVRSAASQDAEREAVIDQLKTMYTGADLDIRVRVYLRSYKTDEEFLKANINGETAGFRATIRLMDSLLAHLGAAELAKPAVVSVAAADFHGFEDG
jgi:hypothetical protein